MEPSDYNMYVAMSKAVGDFYQRGRSASAPPSRPSGRSTRCTSSGRHAELVIEHSFPTSAGEGWSRNLGASPLSACGRSSSDLDREAAAGTCVTDRAKVPVSPQEAIRPSMVSKNRTAGRHSANMPQ